MKTKKNNKKNQAKEDDVTLYVEIGKAKPKKHKKTTSNITRIPRPLGITLLSKQCQLIKDDDNTYKQAKSRLIDRYIQIYLHQGYQMFGKPQSLNTIAEHLGITYIDMMKRISRVWKAIGSDLGSQEGMQDTANGLMAMLLEMGLSDRSRIMAQYHTLAIAQGDGYVPFLSKELNGTLKLLLESQKGLVDIIGILKPQGPVVKIDTNTTNNTNNTQNNILTPHQAIGLLEASNLTNLLGTEKDNMLTTLKAHYIDDSVPEIVATHQENTHDKNLPDLKKPKGRNKVDASHDNHRVNELDLDEDLEIIE